MDIQTANLVIVISLPVLAVVCVLLFGHKGKNNRPNVKAMPPCNRQDAFDFDEELMGATKVEPTLLYKSHGMDMLD